MKRLSLREKEIIRYTANGYTAKEVAKLTGLQYRTIEAYVTTIRKKLAAKNIAHAVYIASQNHLFEDGANMNAIIRQII